MIQHKEDKLMEEKKYKKEFDTKFKIIPVKSSQTTDNHE